MIRARKIPRGEFVCSSRHQDRGLLDTIILLAKLAPFCVGYYVAVFGGFIAAITAPPDQSFVIGIAGVIGAAICLAVIIKLLRAAP